VEYLEVAKSGPLSRFAGEGCSRGFAVHALRLRNELPLQGQFSEPKGLYGGERALKIGKAVNKCPVCKMKRYRI